MTKRLARIAPWQAGKVSAVVYFMFGLFFAIPFGIISTFVEPEPGQPEISIGFFLVLPFLYALGGLIFAPLGCWIYNLAASLVGGLEITVREQEDT